MAGKRVGQKIKLTSVDELLCVPKVEGATEIEVDKIRPFKDHPFKVLDDDKMHELVESIMLNGILTPVIVRKIGNDEYEMISGHRRLFAVKQIGLDKIPAIIKRYSDDDAILAMVDSNLQREEILPSEKAFAYKMKYDALKRQGQRNDLTSSQNGKKLWADEKLAKEVGESRNQVHRYMRLTEVIPDILDLVDTKVLALVVAVEISYLPEKVQKWLFEYMKENGACKAYQIYALRGYLKENENITKMDTIRILNENLPKDESNRFQRIELTKPKLQEYFPPFYTKPQMENVIFSLLEQWKKENEKENI